MKHTICLIFLLQYHYCSSTTTEEILNSISKDITSVWSYKDMFPSLASLDLNADAVKAGLQDGKRSQHAIENMLQSAMNKKNVNLFVLGGSVTLGGDLGENNVQLTYHYALAHWWNHTIGSITGSYMSRKVVAVGAVGTTYFGHCWEEYVKENDSFDFATWEFAINDPDSLEYEQAVERFTRDILSFETKPGLIFVNFASKAKIKQTLSKCRQNIEGDKVINFVAEKYTLASIQWASVICKISSGKGPINTDELFKENHPKVMAHAQVAYILINYFIQIMKEKLSRGFQNLPASSIPLPGLLYLPADEADAVSKCYTSITPGPWNPPKHQLKDLQVVENTGFSLLEDSTWDHMPEQRLDSTGGYEAKETGKKLKLSFDVQQLQAKTSKSRIFVTIRKKYFGGNVTFTLDEQIGQQAQVTHGDSSENVKKGIHTYKLGSLDPGTHTLAIQTVTGGCNLCAIIID